jgi:transcriptional regulator with XRE-family HTH domain
MSPVDGGRIAVARRSAGLTQRELADALGTSAWHVERIEAGRAPASYKHLRKIVAVTGRELEFFVSTRPTAPEKPPASAPVLLGDLGVYGRNLVLAALVLLVTIRFFTEVVPIVPRAANFVDIPIFLALGFAALAVRTGVAENHGYLRLGLPSLVFVALAVVSALVNVERTHPAPVLVFIYGFLAPFAVYAATYRIWPPGKAQSLSRTIVALGLVQIAVVALIGIPRFIASDGNPDEISGTFGTNAYQLVFFLLIVGSLLAAIFALEPRRAVARFAPLLILCVFVVVLLAQYRALLATTILVMLLVGVLLRAHARGLLVAVLTVAAFAAAFSYVASHLPRLKLETTATTLVESPWWYAAQRWEASTPTASLYGDHPQAAAVGTGPGTFSSRAWQTFARSDSESRSNVVGGYAQAFMGGGIYTTDVSETYVAMYKQDAAIVEGSRAVTSPHSSYYGLAAEVGLLGLGLIAAAYLTALIRSTRTTSRLVRTADGSDSVPALSLAATVGFVLLLQMGLLENWLEVTRATFLVWIVFAIVTKEVDARSRV